MIRNRPSTLFYDAGETRMCSDINDIFTYSTAAMRYLPWQ